MSKPIKTVGIAMPIFNESDGISTTLRTLDQVLSTEGFLVELFIQDDCSTDQTEENHCPRFKNGGTFSEERVKYGPRSDDI
jgi:hypothetical protein